MRRRRGRRTTSQATDGRFDVVASRPLLQGRHKVVIGAAPAARSMPCRRFGPAGADIELAPISWRPKLVNGCSLCGVRRARIALFGSWGCQVSTGLRDRRSQVEVARRPRKTAGKASNWQQQLRPRCLVSEHRRRPPSPDGEDVIRGGAAPPTPVSDVKEPRGTPDS